MSKKIWVVGDDEQKLNKKKILGKIFLFLRYKTLKSCSKFPVSFFLLNYFNSEDLDAKTKKKLLNVVLSVLLICKYVKTPYFMLL
jgi:hypothetical protein